MTKDLSDETTLHTVSIAFSLQSCKLKLTNTQDNLRRPVVPRAHHRAMVFIIKSRRAEIDQVDLRSEQHSTKLGTPRSQRARGRDIPVVRERLVRVVQQ